MGLVDWFIEDVLGIDIPDQQNPYGQGQDVTIHSTEAYLPIIKGTVKDVKPTVVAFVGTSGDGTGDDIENDLIHKVFVFGKKVESIDAVRIDGVDSESTDWQDDKGNRWLHVRKFPNGMDGYYWEYLQQAGFKSDYKFTDCCCVYVVAESGSEVVTSEPSDVRADLTGLPSTVYLDNGATSEQRYHNNVEHFYQWLTNDSSGPQWDSSQLDVASWMKAAEDCNVQVETYEGSGVYQSRLTFDSVIDTGMKVHEIIKLFRESVRAHMPFDHSTGKYHLILEQDDNYAELEITADDIEGGISTSESADVGKKVNQVVVKYPDIEQNGKTAEAIYPEPGSATDLAWLAEDNYQRKSKNLKLDACNDHYRAMQQGKIEAEHSREGLQAKFTVKPRVYKLKPGQVVKVTDAERGWDQKPFRILGKTLHKDLFSDLSLREHQPYIYDYHNTGLKPNVPDTTLDPNKLNAPTDLVITDSAYGGKKATWVSTYAKFDWQLETVAGVIVDSGVLTNTTLELSRLTNGTTYVLAVRARNNIGKVSPWVESDEFTYVGVTPEQNLPNNPLNPSVPTPEVDNPVTQDRFVWKVYYSTTDYGTEPDTQAASYGGLIDYSSGQTFTIPDALPNTDYYVWFGLVKRSQSNELPTTWIKYTVTSGAGIGSSHLSNDVNFKIDDPFSQLSQQVQDAIARAFDGGDIDSIFEGINTELQNINVDIQDINVEMQNINYTFDTRIGLETIKRQEMDAKLLGLAASVTASREELRRRIASGEELIGAMFELDPEGGIISNRAFAYTDESFSQASLLIDGVSSSVDIAVERITTNETEIASLGAQIELIPGQITATATSIVSEQIAALEPAHAFNFFDSVQGWAAVNGTISAGTNEVSVTWGDIENDSLAYDASENQVIKITLERTAGAGWAGDVIIERDNLSTETFAGMLDEPGTGLVVLVANFSGDANYSGTINRVRLVLGESAADEFDIKFITIGKADASLQEYEALNARVTQAEVDIDANEAAITSRVTVADYNANTVTFSNVGTVIDGLASIIELTATQQSLIDGDTISKANAASTFIDGSTSTITDIVSGIQNDIDDNTSQITQAQSTLTELGARTSVLAANRSEISRIEDMAQFLTDAANQGIRNAAKTNEINNLAYAINEIRLEITEGGAVATAIDVLNTYTVTNDSAVEAILNRVSQVETDSEGNASAISQLELDVTDVNTQLGANISRLDSIELTNDGQANAIAALQLSVTDAEGDITANSDRIDTVEITNNNQQSELNIHASAISQLQLDVVDVTSSLTSTVGRLDQAELNITNAESNITSNANAISALQLNVSGLDDDMTAAVTRLDQAELDITNAENNISSNASAISALQLNVSGLDDDMTAAVTRLDQAELDITNAENNITSNANAISALQLNVSGLDGDLSSTISRMDQAELDITNAENGISTNANAISGVQATVNNATTGLSATYTIASQAKTQGDTNASSITSLSNRVTTAENDLSANINLATNLDESLNAYRATAQLSVAANGSVSLIQLDASPSFSGIAFKTSEFRLLNLADEEVVKWDASKGTYRFIDGLIEGGTIRGATIEIIGDNTMRIMSPDAFGPNNLVEWRGPKSGNVDVNGDVIYSNLTKVNATRWTDANGNEYTSGTIIAGTLTVSMQNPQISNTTQISTNEFESNGGMISINCSFTAGASTGIVDDGSDPTFDPNSRDDPYVTLRLYRVSPGTEVLVDQHTFNGDYIYSDKGPEYIEDWHIYGATFTFYDTLNTTSNREYRLEADVFNMPMPGDGTGNSRTQRLSILTQEA